MFTSQISLASQHLVSAGLSPEIANVLMGLLGNCQGEIVHRGPVVFNEPTTSNTPQEPYGEDDWPTDENEPIPEGAGYPEAVITINTNTHYNPTTGEFCGRAGVVINGPLVVNGPVFARLFRGGIAAFVFTINQYSGVNRYGVAQANWHKGAGRPYVVVKECDDDIGTNVGGPNITVYLPRNGEQDPNVVAGDVVGFCRSKNGVYVANTPYLDDKIGTVKMWVLGSSDIPAGWAIMDGTSNAAGSGIDAISSNPYCRFNNPAGTAGGTLTYPLSGDITIDGLTFNVTGATFSDRTYTTDAASVTITGGTGYANVSVEDHAGYRAKTTTLSAHEHDLYVNLTSTSTDYEVHSGSGAIITTYAYENQTLRTDPDEDWDDLATTAWRSHDHELETITHSASDLGHTHSFTAGSHSHMVTVTGSHWNHTHGVTWSASSATASLDPLTIEPTFLDLIPIERIDNSSG